MDSLLVALQSVHLLTPVGRAGHLAHRLFDALELLDQSLLGLSEVGVIVFT